MPKVKVGDIDMYYEIHGEGEPLVLNSGAGGRVESQERRIEVFSPEYQVIAYEVRGAGRSDAPDIPYTMEMLADDLSGLLDEIGVTSAHIFGESFGSLLAQYFTLQYPERVRSLILASSGTGPGDKEHSVLSQGYWNFLRDFSSGTPEERAEAMIRFFFTQEYIDNHPDYFEKRREKMKTTVPNSPHGMTRLGQAQAIANTYDRLPDIKAPSLIVHGEADMIIPVENARILASRIPNAELVTLPNTGHALVEAGDKLYGVILDFLRRHSSTGKGVT